VRDPVVRLRAATALAEQGKVPAKVLHRAIDEAPVSIKRSLLWAAYLRLYRLGDPAFKAELETAIAGSDPVTKLDAAQTLARAGNSKGLIALVELTRDAPDLVDRVDAAAVQAELGDVGSVQTLEAALTSEQPQVRARAATSLGRLAQALPDLQPIAIKLKPLLEADTPQERAAAAAALVSITAHLSARRSP
jgi:HEAT repeat protein